MNAFCPNLSNKKVKQEFDELTSLFGEDAAYFLWDKNNGYSLDKAPNGADSILFKSLLDNYNGDRQAALKAKAKVYTSSFMNWFGDWTKKYETSTSKIIDFNDAVDFLFEVNPELSKVGTKSEYEQYIKTIFPNSISNSIYWHGTDSDFSDGLNTAKRGKGSGAPETQNEMYFNRQPWASLQYISGINRRIKDNEGFNNWVKLWWELKEALGNGRMDTDDWKNEIIGPNIRQSSPNKHGVFDRDKGGTHGKYLSERKARYGYENKSDKEFFEEVFDIRYGKETFNDWINRKRDEFKNLWNNRSVKNGIIPAVLNIHNPITEEGQNTYYEEQRSLFTQAKQKGNDAILSNKSKNEFGSDVAVVFNPNENVHFLGTKSDIEDFKKWKNNNQVSKIVDENGEPLVVYHTVSGDVILKGEANFAIFDPNYEDTSGENPSFLYFTDNKEMSKSYFDDNRVWKNIDEIDKDIDKNMSLLNKIKPKLKLTSYELMEDFAKKFNWSVEEMIKESGFETIDDFLKQNYRQYTPEGIQEQVNEIVERIDFLNNIKNNPKLLNPTRAFYISEKTPFIVEGKGKNWDELTISDIDIDELIKQKEESEKYKKDLLREQFNKYINEEEISVLDDSDLIDMIPEEVLDEINKKVDEKYPNIKKIESTRSIEKRIKNNDNFDGTFIKNISDWGSFKFGRDYSDIKTTGHVVAVKRANQIKSIDNKGTFSDQNDSVYESKQDIISQQEREQIYNFIEDKKKRYLSTGYYKMDKSRREIIKDYIRKEFESKFSHFRLKFSYDEKRDRLTMYTEPKSKKDIAQWQSIIFGKQNANSPFSQSDTEAVMREILKAVRGTSIHERFIADAIAKALKGKHISFEFTTSLPLNTAARYDSYRHVVQINSYATFRNDNNYSNSLTQTIMHELLHAVTVETINGNEELKSKLENLLSEVKKALGEDAKDYGLSDIYEFLAELSNINFVHKLQQIKVDKKDTTFFQRVRNFVNEVIRKIALSIGVHKNTAYEDAMDLLMQSMFPQDFKLKIVYQENAPTLFDSTAQQNEVKSKIQKQFSILYKAYKKLPNKSAKREQIQNKIFETINELQLQDDQLAINTALNMAIQNIGIVDNLSGDAAKNTVLGFLQQQSRLQDPYSNITADELVLMYQNSIAFYSNLVKNEIPSVNDKNMTSNNRALKKEVEASIDSAYSLWKEALVVVTDKIVDDIVDNEVVTSEDSTKDDMKQVLKDYLHRNAMYGDINTWYEYTSNNARSQSPLIKAAFNLIQYAETKTLEESYKERSKILNAYEKANKISKQLTRNWQKQFMEFDRNGVPTGYFIRPINYGQYLLDIDAEVERINQDFQNRYGFHYITDDVTGKLINSVTKQFADDEEWEDGKMPHIVEYQLALYDFKCTHANLRYTYDYYKERLSQPYKGSLDPDNLEAKQLSECHGLSPKTLAKYNLIQSNINYYLNKCKDKETGFSYPERLTDPEDQRKLDMWKHQLEQLSNAYNEDGTIKTDEDRQIAFELKAWQKWIGSQINSDIDYDSYMSERKKIEEECNKTGDFTPLQLFVKYNSTIGINPNLINMIFQDAEDINPESHDVIYARLIRGMLKSAVKGDGLEPDLRRMMNNIQFWIDCKNTDQIIEDGGEHNTETHDFSDYFYMHPVPYRDEQGYYLNEDLEQTVNEDEAISFYQYMVDHYTQIAQNDGYIAGLNDDEGNPIDFSQQSENDIRTFFKDLFTYTYLKQDFETGLMTESRKPLSIFSYLEPLNKVFNNKDGKTEFSIIEIPRGRFLQKSNPKYINEQYDIYQNQSEQPNPFYYDNSEAYDKMMSDDNMRTLYEQLIQSMQQSQQRMEFNNQQFNYQLPKLQASDVVSILRLTKKGTKSALDNIREQFLNVNTNDYNQRSTDDLYLGPDQTVNQNIPLKFIGKLKDREKYTYDVTSAVLMYVNMASNYKNKRNILTKLQALRYAQDPENREETINDTKNIRSQYDSMMDSHVYGNLYKNSRTRIIAGTIKRLSTLQMLGANFLSMGAGFMDSTRNIIKDGIVGRYFTLRDLSTSLISTLKNLPLFLINIGNPIANNKQSALMQLFGISKDYAATSSNVGTNRFIKILNQSLMGGYSALDYVSNATLLRAFMNNYRFYDGDTIPKGFYTKYEMQQLFLKAGKSKFKANLAHMSCGTTLYGAYKFNNGLAEIKPEYEQYITERIKKNIRGITLLRGSLINGVNPDNDNPKYKNTMWGQFIGSMRAWMLQRSQELYAGRDDVSVREVEEKSKENIVNGKIKNIKTYEIKNRTVEQQNKRMSWNYSIGMPEPELLKALGRSLGVMLRGITNIFSSGVKRKLSQVEKFAIRQTLIEIGMILSMIYTYDSINNWCKDVSPINPQKETIYTPEEVIQSKLYKEWIRNSYVRTVNSAIEQWDVNTVGEIVNSATVLSSGIKSWYSIPSVILTQDPSSLEPYGDKIIKQGKYKGFTNLEASIWKTLGVLNNLHSSLTYNGVSANTSFYSRNYSWWMKMLGDQYKPIKATKTSYSSYDDIDDYATMDDYESSNDETSIDDYATDDAYVE